MSRANARNVANALEAKEHRKAKRRENEKYQKLLNTKSPKCRSILGMLLYQNQEVRDECKQALNELVELGM